jgi:tetratricopeptide (TPR) repeat protein
MATVLGAARKIKKSLSGLRRSWPRERARSRSPIELVNLAPNPGFRPAPAGSDTSAATPDGLYVHVHNVAHAMTVPGPRAVTGVRVTGTDGSTDTFVAPGGRESKGQLRLGMRPGQTYTASVHVVLSEPLRGLLRNTALRIVVGTMNGSATDANFARSVPALNEHGDHRISLTFTVPDDVTSVWIRLVSGASDGMGEVYWHSFMLTETSSRVDYFDGSQPADEFFTYTWTGGPHASPSRRVLRDPAAIAASLGADARRSMADKAAQLAASGQSGEADALIRYLRSVREDSDLHRAVARVSLAEGDQKSARSALRTAIKQGDPSGDAAFVLGTIEEKARAWGSAAKRYREALDKEPTNSGHAYSLVRMLDRLGRLEEAKAVAAAGVEADADLPFSGHALLDRGTKAFSVRMEVGRFLAENLGEIRTRATQRLERPASTSLHMPIFVYWGQGFDAAPAVVQRCHAALRLNNPSADIHELTDTTVPYYVDIPEAILTALGDDRTHKSDLIRLALLERYGGVWMDATCYASEPLAPRVESLLESADTFAFTYSTPMISSWFLASRPGSYVIHLWRAALFMWWEERAHLLGYFLLHHFFEMLYEMDDRFRADWDKGIRLSSDPPHALQATMLEDYEPARYRSALENSFIHKLTHKARKPLIVSPDSFISHFARGDLPLHPGRDTGTD